MHRSRIGVVLLDVAADQYDEAARFWEEVAGRTAKPEADEPYASLGRLDGVELALQRTGAGTPPRVHLDVETDDVPAEVDRLVGLGAAVTSRFDDYVILADPAGHPFCVVPVQAGSDFDASAHAWE
jgi:hypothetical protein